MVTVGKNGRLLFSSRRRHTRSKRDWSSDCALPISAPYPTHQQGQVPSTTNVAFLSRRQSLLKTRRHVRHGPLFRLSILYLVKGPALGRVADLAGQLASNR